MRTENAEPLPSEELVSMKTAFGVPDPDENRAPQYDFSRVGGFRIGQLPDTSKAQLLRRIADWAKDMLVSQPVDKADQRWMSQQGRALEALMKAANQVAVLIETDRLTSNS
jgi:hypothetical protein